MKKYFLFFIIYSVTIPAQYTTPNTGVVWNLDSLSLYSGGVVTGNFPQYEITNKVTISAADKVTILPGTTVMFINSASGFDVYGRFVASGTITDSIYLTSPLADSLGAYNGFQFNAAAVDSECIINYASIKYAYYGMRCIDASPTISNSYLFKCRRGVQLSTSDTKIVNNVIERSYEYGILINLNSNPLIENNIIKFNNTQATSAKNQVSIGTQGTNSPVIRNNFIHGGRGIVTGGISLWVAGATSSMIVEDNEIFNNSFGITVYVTSGTSNAQIRNNRIYNNNTNPNQLISGSGINVNGVPGNTPVIARNEIYGNWWGITIQNGTTVQAGPQPNIGNMVNSDTTDDGYNIIYNNVQDTIHYDLYNNCTNDVFAQNNDWRVYDSTLIESHVYHKVDNNIHGFVKFMPYSSYIPVELISFSAHVQGNSVIIKWTTASESNNKGFEIQTLENRTWQTISFVEGKGTTADLSYYSFEQVNISEGLHRYRLKQIDYNGTYQLSDEIEVNVTTVNEFALYQNYPNPFNPATNIEFAIPDNAGITTLKVFDILGKEIAVLINSYIPAGIHKVKFNTKELSTGIYFYELSSGRHYAVRKMILMR